MSVWTTTTRRATWRRRVRLPRAEASASPDEQGRGRAERLDAGTRTPRSRNHSTVRPPTDMAGREARPGRVGGAGRDKRARRSGPAPRRTPRPAHDRVWCVPVRQHPLQASTWLRQASPPRPFCRRPPIPGTSRCGGVGDGGWMAVAWVTAALDGAATARMAESGVVGGSSWNYDRGAQGSLLGRQDDQVTPGRASDDRVEVAVRPTRRVRPRSPGQAATAVVADLVDEQLPLGDLRAPRRT